MLLRLIVAVSIFLSCHTVLAQKSSELPLPDFVDNMKEEISRDDMATLKAQIKSEVIEELKSSEVEWQQTVKPQLNFLELDGYFRLRMDAFNRCDLGTYIATNGPGTSGCLPPLNYFDERNPDEAASERPSWLVSSNMRLRVNPTLNVSEDIRIKGTVDVLDNLVLGSTPDYMTGLAISNPSYPYSFLSSTQNSPLIGVNSPYGSINVKRLWGEITTPIGELRFGRMPINFGLGLLFNSGDLLTSDYGDNLDGILFATRVFGHYLIPGAFVSYSGPVGRGRGMAYSNEAGKLLVHAESGQRYDLDPSDNVYSFILSFVKKEKTIDSQTLLNEGKAVFNYGLLAAYRFQLQDTLYTKLHQANESISQMKPVDRNAHMGSLSLWTDVRCDTFHFEVEGVYTLGYIGNTNGLLSTTKADLPSSFWLSQGGVALRSKYGFLNDRLQVGLDGGFASGGHENKNLNFRFNPDYRIDMLLFNEILGTVSAAYYVKPHASYYFTDNLGIRGDVIGSFATNPSLTPGKNNVLGLELDATAFYQVDEGFHFMLKYGLLIPFSGLNHTMERGVTQANLNSFGTAKTASAIQAFFGIDF